jgi:ABC-type phosphate/phosphonate transport system substrate-binding protein
MIAAWPMYDRAEMHEANDVLWATVAKHLDNAPTALTRDLNLWDIWQSPDLLMSQTCGYPYRARLHEHVTYVTTPDFAISDCPAGYYNSVIIAREDAAETLHDLKQKRFAYNEALSQSGWAGPISYLMDIKVTPNAFVETGAHVESALAVAQGRADFAGVDAHTWRLICRYDDWARDLKVLATTPATPALPIICARDVDPLPIRNALYAALGDLDGPTREILDLAGFVEIEKRAYLDVRTPPAPSEFTA